MRRLVAPLAAAALISPVLAQSSFGLTVTGGSVPGPIDLGAGPFIPNGVFGVVLVSLQSTSIPLFVFDPADTRSLSVGLESGFLSSFGPVTDGSGMYTGTSFSLPNQPSFIDGVLHFQSTYIPGPQFFLGPLSFPQAVRLGPAGSFHSRGTIMNSQRSFFPTATLPDGRVMIPGGGSGALLAQVATSQVDIYDEITGQFEFAIFMNDARSLHTATTMLDGRIMVCGGVDLANNPTNSVDIYDPAIGLFVSAPAMTTPRMGHTATPLITGEVLVTGGLADLNQTVTPLDPVFSAQLTTEIFDPFTDTWRPGPDLSEERAAHTAVELPDGRILLAGGIGFTSIFVNIPTVEDTTDIYDPFADSMVAGPTMTSQRALFPISDLGNGRFLAAGGVDDLSIISQGTPTNSCEIFDFNAMNWTAAAPMVAARALGAAYPIGNDRFIHLGGGDSSVLAPAPLDSVEIYDANTDSWTPGPNMPSARAAFGSYQDLHGQVHILGGSDPIGVVNTDFWYYR